METTQRFSKAQCFDVLGHIEFVVAKGARVTDTQACEFVREIDKRHPWVSYTETGELAPSIDFMQAISWKDGRCTVQIRPSDKLKPERLYAYNRYLDNLAKRLAAMDIPGVYAIKFDISFTGEGETHLTSEGQRRVEEMKRHPLTRALETLFRNFANRPKD